jgi:transposase
MPTSPRSLSRAGSATTGHLIPSMQEQVANRFIRKVKERKADELKAWIDQLKKCLIPKLRTFAAGLDADYSAVHAALSHEWSNGQLEGQTNRLKVIKRMMYGRAGFDLLRIRVLYH